MGEPSRPGQEYLYAMKWRRGLILVYWEVERRPRASQRPRGEPRRIDGGRSLTLDGAIVRAARVIRAERDAMRPPESTLSETEVLRRAAAIGLSNAH